MSHLPKIGVLTENAVEIAHAETAKIEGTLPSWLRGTYFRNGPAKWDISDDFYMKHLFDGFALVIKFQIDGESISMTSKYLQSDDYQKAMRNGKPTHLGFGTRSFPDNNKSLFSRFVSNLIPQETSDNCCTGVYTIGNDLFTGVDGTFFYQIDPATLETIAKLDSNKLFGLNVVSPKPLIDPLTGHMYNIGSFVSASGVKHGIVQIPEGHASSRDALKKSKLVATWPSRWSGSCHYSHSFGMTKNYFVVIDQPFLASITSIAANVVKGKPMMELFEFHSKEKNRFFIVDRATGKPLKVEYMSEESFFFFSVINCYEDNNHIVIDVIGYDDTSNFHSMFVDNLRQDTLSETRACEARRYVVPIAEDLKQFDNEDAGANLNKLPGSKAKAFKVGSQIVCRPQLLTETMAVEGPAINKKFLGRKYRYFYIHPSFHIDFMNKLGKVDTETGDLVTWNGTSTQHPSDPTFLPAPGAASEDDGILMSTITETNGTDKSFLLFLDPKSMTEVARAQFDTRIPLSADGLFVPSQNNNRL